MDAGLCHSDPMMTPIRKSLQASSPKSRICTGFALLTEDVMCVKQCEARNNERSSPRRLEGSSFPCKDSSSRACEATIAGIKIYLYSPNIDLKKLR